MRGRSGSPPLTVQVHVAAVASVLPAASVARTAKEWAPWPTVSVRGDEQEANGPPSRLHSNVEPASVAVKAKSAAVFAVGSGGPEVMLVPGATVSTVTVR